MSTIGFLRNQASYLADDFAPTASAPLINFETTAERDAWSYDEPFEPVSRAKAPALLALAYLHLGLRAQMELLTPNNLMVAPQRIQAISARHPEASVVAIGAKRIAIAAGESKGLAPAIEAWEAIP